MRPLNTQEMALVGGAVCPCRQGEANEAALHAIEDTSQLIYFALPSVLIGLFWLM